MKVALTLIVAASTLATVAPGSERKVPKPGVEGSSGFVCFLEAIGDDQDWQNCRLGSSHRGRCVGRGHETLRGGSNQPGDQQDCCTVAVPGEACSGLASGFGSIGFRSVGRSLRLFGSMLLRIRFVPHYLYRRQAPRAGSRPAKIACGWCRTKTARSIGSTLPRTECVKRFRYRPGPITPFSAMGLFGSLELRAAS